MLFRRLDGGKGLPVRENKAETEQHIATTIVKQQPTKKELVGTKS